MFSGVESDMKVMNRMWGRKGGERGKVVLECGRIEMVGDDEDDDEENDAEGCRTAKDERE